jgi:hypothetical protein
VPSKPTKRKAPLKRRKPAAQHDSDFAGVHEPHDDDDTSTPKGKLKVKSKDIQGLKYLDMIAPLLERLHNDMCDRDSAGNRNLHYDQYRKNIAVIAKRSLPRIRLGSTQGDHSGDCTRILKLIATCQLAST